MEMPGHAEAVIPQLCVELGVLPSELKKERMEDVLAMVFVLQSRARVSKKASPMPGTYVENLMDS